MSEKLLTVDIKNNKLSGSLYGSPHPVEKPSKIETEKALGTFVNYMRQLTSPVFISQRYILL